MTPEERAPAVVKAWLVLETNRMRDAGAIVSATDKLEADIAAAIREAVEEALAAVPETEAEA